MTDNLRRAISADPCAVRCACGRLATFWCQPCDTPVCHGCNPAPFHSVCRALLRTIGALKLAAKEQLS